MTGLDDLDDAYVSDMPDEERNWADESQAFVADPDYLASLDPQDTEPDPTADPFAGLPPAEPEEVEQPKRKPASVVTFLDWSKATPRKEDDFAARTVGVPGTSDKVRDFINHARQEGWYGLFYPVLEYPNRNAAQSMVTKINSWRKSKANFYGIRDGEDLGAKCEKQDGDKFVVWVGLLVAEESPAE